MVHELHSSLVEWSLIVMSKNEGRETTTINANNKPSARQDHIRQLELLHILILTVGHEQENKNKDKKGKRMRADAKSKKAKAKNLSKTLKDLRQSRITEDVLPVKQ